MTKARTLPWTIVSPSYRRAGKTRVREVFPYATLVIGAEEEDEYREEEGEPLVVMPEGVQGNISRVRNWILENIEAEWLIVTDDDLKHLSYHEHPKEHVRPSRQELEDFLTNGFVMAEDIGAFLWGVNIQFDPRFYREYSPFSLISPVLGPFSCIRRNPLRYDERLSLNEDYDYSLQHLWRYHRILRFNKWHYAVDHLTLPGGVAAYRTLDREKEQAEVMLRKWGRQVVSYKFERSVNPRIRCPYKGL